MSRRSRYCLPYECRLAHGNPRRFDDYRGDGLGRRQYASDSEPIYELCFASRSYLFPEPIVGISYIYKYAHRERDIHCADGQ